MSAENSNGHLQTRQLPKEFLAAAVKRANELSLQRAERPYRPSSELKFLLEVQVETAHMPLMLVGEPGGGKTAAAYHLQHELMQKTQREGRDANVSLHHISCHDNLSPREILYRFDHLARLRAATDGKVIPEHLVGKTAEWLATVAQNPDLATSPEFISFAESVIKVVELNYIQAKTSLDPMSFMVYGPLGEAIIRSINGEESVVLIDEIDKTPPGFEDQLLEVIEHLIFTLEEAGLSVAGNKELLHIIITSNDQRELSKAFLRRLMVHEIKFPSKKELEAIVHDHLPQVNNRLARAAINFIIRLRNELELNKPPSTAEVIQWIKVMQAYNQSAESIEAYEVPLLEMIIKDNEDRRNVEDYLRRRSY